MRLTVAALASNDTAFAVRNRVPHGTPVQGCVSPSMLTAFAAGRQAAMLDVFGDYLWRPLVETRRTLAT